MASQFDLESKLSSIDLDFPLSLFLFKVQNLGEVMTHFPFDLAAVADHYSID